MCPKAVTALLMALASVQLSTRLLLAKPTRPLAHQATRRLIVTQPAPRSSRDRKASANSIVPSRAHSRLAERGGSYAGLTHARGKNRQARNFTRGVATSMISTGRLRDRARNPAHARTIAAHVPMVAAERNLSYSVRPLRTTIRHRHQDEGIATGDEPMLSSAPASSPLGIAAGNASDVSDAGGLLRHVPGTLPLKSIEEEASTPVLLPPVRVTSLYDSRGRLVVPPPLYGSREILLHQNEMADRDGLIRVQDDADLLDLRRAKKLVALPDNETLRVDFRLPENRRFSRPWTAAFLSVLARDYYDSFHSPLQVDSAVRTVAVQQRLIRTNGNAAPSTGDTASPHLTGQAVDIAKGGLSRTQIAWMRTYLQPLIDLGKIDVEEEFRQSCFHISVYRNFLPATAPHVSVAAYRQLPPETPLERPEY